MSEAGVRSSLQAKKSVHRTNYAVPKLSLSTSCETGKVKISFDVIDILCFRVLSTDLDFGHMGFWKFEICSSSSIVHESE